VLIAIIFEAHADEKTINPSFNEFFGLGKPYVADGYNITTVTCKNSRVKGARTEYSLEKGFYTFEDGAYLDNLVYVFSKPYAYVLGEEEGLVSIHYGDRQTQGTIIARRIDRVTVVYSLDGMPYMDTIFPKEGVVLSSEHKHMYQLPIATEWRLKCEIN